jgi:hypothetical protein
MTKLPTRYSSRNRTAADLEVLDQQFKNWLDSIAAVLGHRSTTQKGGVMMVGGEPYGMGTITEYHALPEGSTIMVEMSDVKENVAMMSMKATFKAAWAKQVAKHNTGDDSITIHGMVKVDDSSLSKAAVLVEMFNEAVKSVIQAEKRRSWFEDRYEPSATALRTFLSNSLVKNKLVASSSDVVIKPESYTAVVESGAPYGVGSFLIKDVLGRVVDSYAKAGKPVPKMTTLKKSILTKVDRVASKAMEDFKTSDGIIGTYVRWATWKGDGVEVAFMLNFKADGEVRPHHLMGHIASSDMQIRQAYLRHMLK